MLGRRLAIAFCALLAPSALLADTVTVFAAASLRESLTEIAQSWKTETGHEARLSFAGSSVLARQIQRGAPADVFISANTAWMDVVEQDGLIATGTRFDLLGNHLVLVTSYKDDGPFPITPSLNLPSLLRGGRLAMALVAAVPAGIYGREALTTLGLWESVAADVVQTDNVRAALALAALGEVRMAIVYESDARSEPKVWQMGRFPEDSHSPIRYPAAATVNAQEAGRAFLAYLQTDAAADVFERYGFAVLTR